MVFGRWFIWSSLILPLHGGDANADRVIAALALAQLSQLASRNSNFLRLRVRKGA
jgi:hypothetical protein